MENQIQVVEGIKRVEYGDQPVLTTAQLAEFYETTVDNLRVNFSYAQKKDRFVEGKHFFRLDGDALKEFKDYIGNSCLVGNRAPSLYLWTKRGASRHAKMLNNDKAWEVFEALEDNYFNRPAFKQNEFLTTFAKFVDLEREKFNLANSRETKTMAKVQLLRELASASKDDFVRNELVIKAARLLLDEDFGGFTKVSKMFERQW